MIKMNTGKQSIYRFALIVLTVINFQLLAQQAQAVNLNQEITHHQIKNNHQDSHSKCHNRMTQANLQQLNSNIDTCSCCQNGNAHNCEGDGCYVSLQTLFLYQTMLQPRFIASLQNVKTTAIIDAGYVSLPDRPPWQ